MNRVGIKPELLRWAQARSGQSTEYLQRRFPKLDSWESGATLPTFKQLEDFAKVTRTPIGFLFLLEPPVEELPVTDFRTMGDVAITRPSPDLLDTLYLCQQRQDWFRDEIRTLGESPQEFIGSLDMSLDVLSAGARLRDVLGLDGAWRQQSANWTEALHQFINKIDALGILVMVSGVVGNNTHRQLKPAEFRGFALSDPWAPLVFINGADTKAAQMFTLAHEMVHLWLGESGISNPQMATLPDHTTERWCNQVAAELLVPAALILHEFDPRNALHEELRRLARQFKVSTLVILRRIYDTGGISWDEFHSAYGEEMSRLQDLPGSRGGNAISNIGTRASKRFARALVISVLEGRTSYTEAFRLLGLRKLSTFEKVAASLGVRT